MPDEPAESNAQRIRRLSAQLARIRNELQALVGEQSHAQGQAGTTSTSGDITSGNEDPLERILKMSSPPVTSKSTAVDPEAEDVVVVDISLKHEDTLAKHSAHTTTSSSTSTTTGTVLPDEDKIPEPPSEDKKRKDYPKKPPPHKRK